MEHGGFISFLVKSGFSSLLLVEFKHVKEIYKWDGELSSKAWG